MDLPTRLDLFAIGRKYVVERAKRIDPKKVDEQGSDANVFVGSTSMVAWEVIKQSAFAASNLMLDTVEDDDALDRLAWDRYQMRRKGASPALGAVRFFRTSGAIAGSVPAGAILKTLGGVEYITTTQANFIVGDLVSSANVRAVLAGKTSQVGANQIRTIAKAGDSPLFDPSLQVTNDDPTSGGEERELLDDFRERVRRFWRTAQRGTLAAIEEGALSVPGVASAQAVELFNDTGEEARVVLLYIADSSGIASQAQANAVTQQLDEFRAAGIPVIVATSVPQIVTIKLRLAFAARVDTDALAQQVVAAVAAFVNSLSVNEVLRTSDLQSVLVRFRNDGLVVPAGAIVEPLGDVVPDPGRTIRATADSVSVVQ